MPIDTSLLRPVDGPALPNFDRIMQLMDQGKQYQTTQAVGQAAASGDYAGASRAAFQGGDLKTGASMVDFGNQQHVEQLKAGAQALIQASQDPAMWAQYQRVHPEIGPFANRDQIVRHAVDALDPQGMVSRQIAEKQAAAAQANADRTYQLQVQQANKPQEVAAGASVFDPKTKTFIQAPFKPGVGAGEYGLNPIFSQDDAGNVTAYQPSKAGGVKPIEVPAGQRVMGPGDKAAATATGKAQGTNAVNLPTVEGNASRLSKAIDDALADPSLGSVVGPLQGRLPAITGGQNRAQSYLDEIKGAGFLQAYNDLRGAGAITEQEGAKATAAYNRLQRQSMSDEDYRKALTEFRDEVQKMVGIARQKAGKGGPAPETLASPGRDASTAGNYVQAGSQGNPIQVQTPEDAMRLPPGTVFVTPDGRTKVR